MRRYYFFNRFNSIITFDNGSYFILIHLCASASLRELLLYPPKHGKNAVLEFSVCVHVKTS